MEVHKSGRACFFMSIPTIKYYLIVVYHLIGCTEILKNLKMAVHG